MSKTITPERRAWLQVVVAAEVEGDQLAGALLRGLVKVYPDHATSIGAMRSEHAAGTVERLRADLRRARREVSKLKGEAVALRHRAEQAEARADGPGKGVGNAE